MPWKDPAPQSTLQWDDKMMIFFFFIGSYCRSLHFVNHLQQEEKLEWEKVKTEVVCKQNRLWELVLSAPYNQEKNCGAGLKSIGCFLRKEVYLLVFLFFLAERMMEKRFLQNRVLAHHSCLSPSNPQRLIPQLEQKLNLLPWVCLWRCFSLCITNVGRQLRRASLS